MSIHQGTVLTVPKGAAVIFSTALPKAVAQRQRSDKNQMFLPVPVLKPTFKGRCGCTSAWADGSKEGIILRLFSARLKPCPDKAAERS